MIQKFSNDHPFTSQLILAIVVTFILAQLIDVFA